MEEGNTPPARKQQKEDRCKWRKTPPNPRRASNQTTDLAHARLHATQICCQPCCHPRRTCSNPVRMRAWSQANPQLQETTSFNKECQRPMNPYSPSRSGSVLLDQAQPASLTISMPKSPTPNPLNPRLLPRRTPLYLSSLSQHWSAPPYYTDLATLFLAVRTNTNKTQRTSSTGSRHDELFGHSVAPLNSTQLNS